MSGHETTLLNKDMVILALAITITVFCILNFMLFILFNIAQEMSLETGLTNHDYAIVTKAWFQSNNKDLTIRNIKEECEIRSINIPKMSLRFTENNLRNWTIYFGVQAIKHELVNLKTYHSPLSLNDIVCHK